MRAEVPTVAERALRRRVAIEPHFIPGHSGPHLALGTKLLRGLPIDPAEAAFLDRCAGRLVWRGRRGTGAEYALLRARAWAERQRPAEDESQSSLPKGSPLPSV